MAHGPIRAVGVVAVLGATLMLSTLFIGGVRVVPSADVAVAVAGPMLNVTGVSYSFTPDRVNNLTVNTTYDVIFTDASTNNAAHTFTILGREGIDYPSSADVTAIAYNRTYPPIVNINATGSGPFTKNFTSPKTPGWYEFVCTEAGHFSLGMYGFISFGMNLPANLTVSAGQTGPGTAVFIIVGTIVSLTVIAIVLGFVVGRRHGAEQEMPPERLGYPEPALPGGGSPPPSSPPGPPKP
jgi:hypothetical protein